jgi:hypothetical protein
MYVLSGTNNRFARNLLTTLVYSLSISFSLSLSLSLSLCVCQCIFNDFTHIGNKRIYDLRTLHRGAVIESMKLAEQNRLTSTPPASPVHASVTSPKKRAVMFLHHSKSVDNFLEYLTSPRTEPLPTPLMTPLCDSTTPLPLPLPLPLPSSSASSRIDDMRSGGENNDEQINMAFRPQSAEQSVGVPIPTKRINRMRQGEHMRSSSLTCSSATMDFV